MKKISLLLLSLSLLFSCNKDAESGFVIISGKIENQKSDQIGIYSDRELINEIDLSDDGTFRDTLEIKPGYYSIGHGRERSDIYLYEGFDLKINIDTEAFDESLIFDGIGSQENNYLAKKYLYKEETIGSARDHYKLEEGLFREKLNDIRDNLTNRLVNSVTAESDFISLEKQNLEYEFIDAMNKYESYHAYYAEKSDFEVSDDFLPQQVKNMTFNDPEAYRIFPSYRNLARNELSIAISEAMGEDFQNAKAEHFKALAESEIPELKNSYIDGTGRFMISPANPNMVEIYEFFMEQLSDEEIKINLTDRFETNKNLMPGMPSPVFKNYENHSGGTTSLEDLKGRYVYIDVWATWCAPCIREVPYLKEIEEEYGEDNISFVSTSIDVASDHNKWVKMVNDKALGGIQLFADNDWNSAFVKDYGIEGIPRFILIDPDGNIVTADAPRPSNEKLKELFEEIKL